MTNQIAGNDPIYVELQLQLLQHRTLLVLPLHWYVIVNSNNNLANQLYFLS